jgi:hypothetical protein
MQFQKKYNLRSKKAHVESQQPNPIRDPQQTNPIRKYLVDIPSTSRLRQDNPTKEATKKVKSKEEVPRRASETSRETCTKEVEKVSPPFNFENEMTKIKIFVPFNELINKGEYRD